MHFFDMAQAPEDRARCAAAPRTRAPVGMPDLLSISFLVCVDVVCFIFVF